MNIKICPTCGSNKIKRVIKDWTNKFNDKTYTVPALQYMECSDCGEKIYDKEAMLKMEENRPA